MRWVTESAPQARNTKASVANASFRDIKDGTKLSQQATKQFVAILTRTCCLR